MSNKTPKREPVELELVDCDRQFETIAEWQEWLVKEMRGNGVVSGRMADLAWAQTVADLEDERDRLRAEVSRLCFVNADLRAEVAERLGLQCDQTIGADCETIAGLRERAEQAEQVAPGSLSETLQWGQENSGTESLGSSVSKMLSCDP